VYKIFSWAVILRTVFIRHKTLTNLKHLKPKKSVKSLGLGFSSSVVKILCMQNFSNAVQATFSILGLNEEV